MWGMLLTMNPRPAMPPINIRIALMCENPAVYRSLGPHLSADRMFEVVGTFDCVLDNVPELAATGPDIVILGIARITHFNMMVCQAIKPRCPDVSIIVLPSYIDATDEVRAAREAGADSVMLKSIDTPALVQQIHTLVELKS
jgi:DNA-binding NarL/FixJ family response regulator